VLTINGINGNISNPNPKTSSSLLNLYEISSHSPIHSFTDLVSQYTYSLPLPFPLPYSTLALPSLLCVARRVASRNNPPSIYHQNISPKFSLLPFSSQRAKGPDLRTTPGIQPKQSSRMLISRSTLHPVFRNTATKGRKMASR
jgi:hypothetical protein